jgi:hypothetical protein
MPPKAASKFKVEVWPIEQVKTTTAAYNPRVITERLLVSLSEVIGEFGFLLPCVINKRTNRMVGGHQRVKAAEMQGLTALPIHLIDVDEAQEKALNLALNKIEGKWDYGLLEEALTAVSEADLLSLSGFSETDLVEIMSGQDGEFSETFEQFAGRFAGRKSQDHVAFRSPLVAFTCTKSAYEALVHRLYSKVGVDDIKASVEFFTLIGLGV